MRTPPQILIVDDNALNVEILKRRLVAHGYEIVTASDGEQALRVAREQRPDLILLDIMMPKIDGIEVCRRLKADPSFVFMPVILVTAKVEPQDIVAGLEAGADEYLTKPVDPAALIARVKSMLRLKALYDTGQELSAHVAQLNRTLEQRVAEQVAELDRAARLKRFFSSTVAELITSAGGEKLLESHRREITAVYCQLQGFTALAEAVGPEVVMNVLREYHQAMGDFVSQYEGMPERIAGEGLMVLFNDPLPCPDHAVRAVRMALAMRQQVAELARARRKPGDQLDLGVGIALGEASLGRIGFEGRFDYGAVGPVPTLAYRLCDQARGGQILISARVLAEVEQLVEVEPIGELPLRGFREPVPAFNVVRLK